MNTEIITEKDKQKFWARVDKNGPTQPHMTTACWLWEGDKTRKNTKTSSYYGLMRINGKRIRAHRVSYIIHNGPVPNSLQCMHLCDNSICQNPEHLRLGTNQDNHGDMMEKGRNSYLVGAESPTAKLTESQVQDIRLKYLKGFGFRRLARQFNVGRTTIRHIIIGISWKELSISNETANSIKLVREERAATAKLIKNQVYETHKLTEIQVKEIREIYANGGVTYSKLANDYGFNRHTIKNLLLGKTWKHISIPEETYKLINLAASKARKYKRSKLTELQVKEIREKHSHGNVSPWRLGKEYGVDHKTIKLVIRRETWAHVT